MIYEEPLVWRPGQAMSASADGRSIVIDMAFTDYVLDLLTGKVIYARPALKAWTPTVNVGASTITMTAPEEAWPQEPTEDANGVMIYAHSAFYSAGSPIAWDSTAWDGTGYAFRIGDWLYIFSGLFCKDYKFVSDGFGRNLVNTTQTSITYPFVAWMWLNLYSHTSKVQLGDLTEKAGGLAKRDIYNGVEDPVMVENIANKSVKCGWTALLDGSDDTITYRFQSEDGSISQEHDVIASDAATSIAMSVEGRALLVGYTSYQENAAFTVGSASDTLSITMDADVPKTCDVFTFGDYAPDEFGEVSLIEATILEHIDRAGTWNRIFPSQKIYDRGPNGYGAFSVLTDSVADSFVPMTLAEDDELNLFHWRNSTTGFNITYSDATGAYEFVPASTSDSGLDATGMALTSIAVLRRDICTVVVTALQNAGVY